MTAVRTTHFVTFSWTSLTLTLGSEDEILSGAFYIACALTWGAERAANDHTPLALFSMALTNLPATVRHGPRRSSFKTEFLRVARWQFTSTELFTTKSRHRSPDKNSRHSFPNLFRFMRSRCYDHCQLLASRNTSL